MGRGTAIIGVAIALAAGAAAAGASGPIVIGETLQVGFSFGVSPSKLPRTKPRPVRVSVSGHYGTDDGSHVPALREMQLELDRHFFLDAKGVPVCGGGTRDVRGPVLEGCEDAVVGRGTVEAEVAYPEQPLTAVAGTLTVYNRGRKPGGFDLGGWAYFPAPVTGGLSIPIQVRRIAAGRYRWRVRLEAPKLAGGYGSITSFSARIRKQIVSATCPDGKLQVSAASTFADGAERTSTAVRPCAVAEAHPRQ